MAIDGIRGEPAGGEHAGWLECASVNWKLHQPRSATASTAGGHTAERAELSDVAFTKSCDLASPLLAQHCAMGRTIPKARFEFFRADGQGTRVKYYEVELDNVVIGDAAQSVAAGIGMPDHVDLKFSRVKWRYTWPPRVRRRPRVRAGRRMLVLGVSVKPAAPLSGAAGG